MRTAPWLWCTAIVGWWLVSSASGEEAVRWQVNLESARRVAQQRNQMVLIHFWADWCQSCKEMEREVFARPEVVAALETGFVPVRLNVDHFPHTCQQYGVSVLPSDIIITPQGQLVGRIDGKATPPQYLARLGQVAAIARNRAVGSYGQMSSRPALATDEQAARRVEMPAQQPLEQERSQPPGYYDSRLAYYPSRQREGLNPPTDARYGGPADASQGDPRGYVQGPRAPVAADPTRREGTAVPPAGRYARQTQVPPGRASDSGPSGLSQGDPAVMQQRAGVAGVASRPQLPPGSPPLGLDGYCPLQLSQGERWVLGDPRWGLIHRGRTYLFAGPKERDLFDADPDRYAPVLAGHDVVLALEQGAMVPGHRKHGAWFEQQVYLFSSEATFRKFDAAAERYVSDLRQRMQNVARRPAGPVQRSAQAPVRSSETRPY